MKKILLAIDGSKHSLNAAKKAAEFAKALGGEVTVLNVLSQELMASYIVEDWGFQLASEHKERMKRNIEALDEDVEKVSGKVFEEIESVFKEYDLEIKKIISRGNPAEKIKEIAEKDEYDLIVMGSRGVGGIKGMMLGSVSNRVAQTTKIPILIVK